MSQLIVLLCIFGAATAFSLQTRIVNGTDAQLGEIPYIVSVRFNHTHNCGGSILDETHILTAAHCIFDYNSPSDFSIQYGVVTISNEGPNVIKVLNLRVHEEYSPYNNYANDIAILKLSQSIKYSKVVQPVKLPKAGSVPPAGHAAILAGWGKPYTGGSTMKNLQTVGIFVYSDEDCSRALEGQVNSKYHVCAGVPSGGKGQCSGDSGGPLVVDGVQVGIVSWSVKPCTVKGYPGVFTRVSSYIGWIHKHIVDL